MLYACWDLVFTGKLEDRSKRNDFVWDMIGAIAFLLLWKATKVDWMSSRVYYFDLPEWIGFDIEMRWWVLFAFVLYGSQGPHPWADRFKSIFTYQKVR